LRVWSRSRPPAELNVKTELDVPTLTAGAPRLPRLLLAGVVLFCAAALLDLAAHALGASQAIETTTHVATLIGMALTLAGVALKGLPQHRTTRIKEVGNARR
jgi:hypothetical protein